MSVYLRLNGVNSIGRGQGSTMYFYLNAIVHSTLKLYIGDQISFALPEGVHYDDNISSYTQFSGFILQENLEF